MQISHLIFGNLLVYDVAELGREIEEREGCSIYICFGRSARVRRFGSRLRRLERGPSLLE
jgi:hypothetical protein